MRDHALLLGFPPGGVPVDGDEETGDADAIDPFLSVVGVGIEKKVERRKFLIDRSETGGVSTENQWKIEMRGEVTNDVANGDPMVAHRSGDETRETSDDVSDVVSSHIGGVEKGANHGAEDGVFFGFERILDVIGRTNG